MWELRLATTTVYSDLSTLFVDLYIMVWKQPFLREIAWQVNVQHTPIHVVHVCGEQLINGNIIRQLVHYFHTLHTCMSIKRVTACTIARRCHCVASPPPCHPLSLCLSLNQRLIHMSHWHASWLLTIRIALGSSPYKLDHNRVRDAQSLVNTHVEWFTVG